MGGGCAFVDAVVGNLGGGLDGRVGDKCFWNNCCGLNRIGLARNAVVSLNLMSALNSGMRRSLIERLILFLRRERVNSSKHKHLPIFNLEIRNIEMNEEM